MQPEISPYRDQFGRVSDVYQVHGIISFSWLGYFLTAVLPLPSYMGEEGKQTLKLLSSFMNMRGLIPVIALLLFTGCAVGRKMSFENKTITPDYTAARSLVISFQENRKEVLAGEQKPSYCGKIKSTAQLAYNMQTNSRKPLAEDFTNSVVGSLTKLGIKTQPMIVDMKAPQKDYVEQFLKTDGERLVHFTMKQWEANATPRVVDVRYDVTWEFEVNVFNRSGDLLATKAVADRVTRDEAHLGINKDYLQKMADQIFVEQIRNLLNDPAVKASLMN